MRALFIYWKTREAAEAEAAVRAMQSALRQAHPALQAAFYRRSDAGKTEVTLMETYACAGGVTETLAQQIEAAAAPLARWRDGARHIEVFDELAP